MPDKFKKYWNMKKIGKDSAEILLYEQIGKSWWDDSGTGDKEFVEELKALGNIKNINLHINSPGGSVFDGYAIYNQLVAHKARITVHIDGIAASIASMIAMCGNTIIMPENAMFMIHDPWSGVAGNAEDMRKHADALDKIKLGIISAYKTKSNLSDEEISDLMAEETWMTAKEALDNGFADEIIDAVKVAAQFDLTGFQNVPAGLQKQTGQMEPVDYKRLGKEIASNLHESGKRTKKEENIMKLSEFKVEEPDLHKAMAVEMGTEQFAAGKLEGLKEGQKAENERVNGIRGLLIPGHEALIDTMVKDAEITPEIAAGKIIAAENELRVTNSKKFDADGKEIDIPASLLDDSKGVVALGKDAPLADRAKAEWDADPKIRAEFMDDLDSYVAYKTAEEGNRFKVLKSKEVEK